MPSISIIIPSYITNDEQNDWLIKATQSVFNQSFEDWEVIIVDDASPDAITTSPAPRWRLITHDKQRGAGAARNTGIKAATGEYILCLDSDDLLEVDALQKLWDARCPDGAVYGDIEYIGDKGGLHYLPDFSIAGLLRMTGIMPVTALHTKSAWQAVGGFDEHLTALEDVDYFLKLANLGICGVHLPLVTLKYRKHSGSRQSAAEADRTKLIDIRNELTQRHKSLQGKAGQMGSCKSCPQPGQPGSGSTDAAEGIGPDTLQARYNGPMQGSFNVRSWTVPNVMYTIQGRGSVLTIDARDKAQFEQSMYQGQPNYTFVQPVKQEQTVINIPITANFEPAASLPDLSSMNVKNALKAIEDVSDQTDLRILLATETASQNRKTVTAAIEVRLE